VRARPDARTVALALNGAGALGLALVLLLAHLLQLFLGELPCPLCLLQRVGLVATGFGLILNIRCGPRPLHYGLVLIGALFGAAAAGRQVLLHIVPGSGAYGDPLLGLHLYTWCLILFLLAVAAVALMLLLEGQFAAPGPAAPAAPRWIDLAAAALIAMTALCVVSTFVECGPGECPDNPTSYWLFE
jgi:disulfide bond formation protein DsbB